MIEVNYAFDFDFNMPEVFVLVPSHNHASFVERTLRSIFDQSLKPKRLLVIDDGSSDNSAEIIERTLADCPFESDLIVRGNLGLCKTLNEGFKFCKEEYFAYLGSDDLWLPQFLEISVRNLSEHPGACLSFGTSYLIDKDDFVIDKTENWFPFYSGYALQYLLEGKIFTSPSVVYRSKFMPDRPWNEQSRLEDYDLYLRLAAEHDFAFSPEPLSGWRQHGSNTSGNLPELFPEFMKAHEKALKRSGIDKAEARRLRKRLMFEYAFNFIRHGFREEALRYMFANLEGANSISEVFDLAFRILIPQPIFQWNRNRKYEAARRKYGKLEISAKAD